MALESRTVAVLLFSLVCLAVLFFLDALVRVDNSSTITQDNLRQIRKLRIPSPEYAGIIREQAVYVDMNNPGLRTEIEYQGSPSLAATVVDDTRRATQQMRNHKKESHEQNHQRDLRRLHTSNEFVYKDNETKQARKENDMAIEHGKKISTMRSAQARKVCDLDRDIELAMENFSDSDSSSH